ncbi:hypothetical protein DFH94DRAFT_728419 [Russula ochroleuca]|uniref:Secreted protein n=1 Tax=Russula ochroleuca TaxID=152965 RepID=A0A9P5TB96_9AGAM|nr:hypothetical protein DFH94DRAFT_728419 [Russula ochroleuca]
MSWDSWETHVMCVCLRMLGLVITRSSDRVTALRGGPSLGLSLTLISPPIGTGRAHRDFHLSIARPPPLTILMLVE